MRSSSVPRPLDVKSALIASSTKVLQGSTGFYKVLQGSMQSSAGCGGDTIAEIRIAGSGTSGRLDARRRTTSFPVARCLCRAILLVRLWRRRWHVEIVLQPRARPRVALALQQLLNLRSFGLYEVVFDRH